MQTRDNHSRARDIWLRIHLYLALIIGFLFVLTGLSGSLNVYREELDELLNPRLVIDQPKGEYLPLERIVAAIRTAHPSRHESWTLEMPRSPHGMLTAWYEKPHETFGEYYAPLMVSVDPYTAEVVASRFWGDTAASWIYNLHAQLHLGGFGAAGVGLIGLALAVSAISGLYLWWPGLDRLRQAFAIRHDAGLMRLGLDLHRALGLFSAPILLLLALTGMHLAVPKPLESLLGAEGMGHGENGPDIRGSAVPNNHPVSPTEAMLVARGLFPSAEVRGVATPAGENGTYRVILRRDGEVNARHPATIVWVDRWSGQIREVRNPRKFTAGQTFLGWIWPLHSGETVGAAGRLLWFFAGLTPLALYVFGLMQWLHQRGWLHDRPVELGDPRPQLEKLARALFRLGLETSHLVLIACRAALSWSTHFAQRVRQHYRP